MNVHSVATALERYFAAGSTAISEAAWEICFLQADVILVDFPVLLDMFEDVNQSEWLRTTAGASLVYHSMTCKDEQMIFNVLIKMIYGKDQDEVVAVVDDLQISMLALCIFRRTTNMDLADKIVSVCKEVLEQRAREPFTTNEVIDGLNPACRRAVNILSIIYGRAAELSPTVHSWCGKEQHIPRTVDALLNLLHTDNLFASREIIAKRLIAPLLQLTTTDSTTMAIDHNDILENVVLSVWKHCTQLASNGKLQFDLSTTSTLLCVCVGNPSLHTMTTLSPLPAFWPLLNDFMLSSDAVVRKRGSFILQAIPVSVPVPPLRKDKNMVEKENPERYWWKDYLDIYSHIEGCTSFHLVEQVWPLLNKLSALAVQEKKQTTNTSLSLQSSLIATTVANRKDGIESEQFHGIIGGGGGFVYPVISFSWVKSLLHMLLSHGTTLPHIKKGALHRILTCHFHDPATETTGSSTAALSSNGAALLFECDAVFVRWLCDEVLPLVDSVSYFSVPFAHMGTNVGCRDCDLINPQQPPSQNCFLDNHSQQQAQSVQQQPSCLIASPSSTPGILMPSFLARILKTIHITRTDDGVRDCPSLASDLVLSLVSAVCSVDGLRSLSASKWILRCFAEPVVQAMIPRCLGPKELHMMQMFVSGRLASSSGIVRRQVTEGLVPLFLVASDPSQISLSGLVRMVTLATVTDDTLDDDCDNDEPERYFSLRSIANDQSSLTLLRSAVMECCIHQSRTCGTFDGIDDEVIVVAYCILTDASNGTTLVQEDDRGSAGDVGRVRHQLQSHCEDRLRMAARLYASPYEEVGRQKQLIGFLRGIAGIIDLSSSFLTFPLPRIVEHIAADLASYVSTLLTASISEALHAEQGLVDTTPTSTSRSLSSSSSSSISAASSLVRSMRMINDLSAILGALAVTCTMVLHDDSNGGGGTDNHPTGGRIDQMIHSSGLEGVLSATVKIFDVTTEHLTVHPSSPSLSTGSVLLVVSSSSLLRSLLKGIKTHTSSSVGKLYASYLSESLQRLLMVMIAVQEPASTRFRALTNSITTHGDGGDHCFLHSNPHNKLLSSLVRVTNGQYGKLSALFVGNRWSCIRSCLELQLLILPHNNLPVSSVQRMNIHSSTDNNHHNNTTTTTTNNNNNSDMTEDGHRLLLLILDQLEVCTMDALPDILNCAGIVYRQLRQAPSGATPSTKATLLDILAAAWQTAEGGTSSTNAGAVNVFIRFAFDAALLQDLDHEDVIHEYFCKVEAFGHQNRPHVMQSLVCHLCATWSAMPDLCCPFIGDGTMERLLLYRESRQDDNSSVARTGDDLIVVGGGGGGDASSSQSSFVSTLAGISRFAVLSFLEAVMQNNYLPSSSFAPSKTGDLSSDVTIVVATDSTGAPSTKLSQSLSLLVTSLVALNRRKEYVSPAMIGSEFYGKKLRCWQALCILSRMLPREDMTGGDVVPTLFHTLSHNNGHSIRVYLELFGGSLAQRFPDVMLPYLLKHLTESFNYTQQMLCSLFVILGHLVVSGEGGGDEEVPRQDNNHPHHQHNNNSTVRITPSLNTTDVQSIIDALIPWLTCAQGLPRAIAQLLVVELIPRLLPLPLPSPPMTTDSTVTTQQHNNNNNNHPQYLYNIHRYLTTNRDAIKVMPKQRQLFQSWNPRHQCSVAGLSMIGVDNMGEVMPPHILTLLADFLKAEMKEQRLREKEELEEGDRDMITNEGNGKPAVSMHDEGDDVVQIPSEVFVLQTKRVPFDELNLGIQNALISRKQNAAGRLRQQVVICASLIDKVANLAGIARTCEIFAAECLVMSNLKVCATDTFQGIAVSCTDWLPMSEVPVDELPVWIGSMRRQGYTILGLEQTDTSINLSHIEKESISSFAKCVLLLGKEKEGIPVELLQEIDLCLEIPQYGVVRSLNVHVSAAIALWEITKLNNHHHHHPSLGNSNP